MVGGNRSRNYEHRKEVKRNQTGLNWWNILTKIVPGVVRMNDRMKGVESRARVRRSQGKAMKAGTGMVTGHGRTAGVHAHW